MLYDRDELLARTDLAALADELLGDHHGHGRSARWPSPVPGHPQTGRTPPMSVFTDRHGTQRWTCFATGANGTAIDLVTTATGRTVADAIHWLAQRAHLTPGVPGPVHRESQPPPCAAAVGPSGELHAYLESCERALWEPAGRRILQWLTEERGLDPAVLHRNRVGADPGPRTLARSPGLPHRGPAAVFPVLDQAGHAVYLQARYLHPPSGTGKYDNPASSHGTNPRIGWIEPSHGPTSGPTVVTEGIPDALAAATAGYRAAALLGAGIPNPAVARQLADHPGLLVTVLDADCAGRNGATRLADLLARAGRTDTVDIEPPAGDLNGWLVEQGRAAFTLQLRIAIGLQSAARPSRGRSRSIA